MQKYLKFTIYYAILSLHIVVNGQSIAYQYHPVNEILSKELIKDINKDANGYVWLATDQGVLRFDGQKTELFFKELPNPYTKSFLARKNGQFLILSDVGLHEVKSLGDSVMISPFMIGGESIDNNLNTPKEIFEDRNENIWIAEPTDLVKVSEQGIRRYYLGEDFQSISYHRAFSFAEDAFGNLWIAPYKGKLLSYDQQLDSLITFDIDYPISDVSCIISIKGDYLLIGGKEGVLKLKVDSDRNILKNEFLPLLVDVSTAIAIKDEVYLGTWTEGLYYFNFNSAKSNIEKVNKLNFNDILGLHYDEENKELWVAGSEDVGVFKQMTVSTIENIGKRWVETVTADSKGDLYYSTGQNIYKYVRETSKVEELLYDKNTFFNRLLVEGDKLWVGDAFGGIFSYHIATQQRKSYQTIIDNAITYIYKDKRGSKWFAGNTRKIIKIDQSLHLREYDNVDSSSVIKESPDGTLYCASRGKNTLFYVYDSTRDSFLLKETIYSFPVKPNVRVHDFQFANEQTIFVASDDGFLKGTISDKISLDRINLEEIDDNEPIRAIIKSDSIYWLSISTGLVAYDHDQVVLFTKESGLPSRVLKERGLTEGIDGEIIVTTTQGVAIIDEAFRKISKTKQPIIKSTSINGRAVDPTQKVIKVPYKANVRIEYLSLEYPAANITYQTRIEGYESDWSPISANRNISFVAYNDGKYKFQVKARYSGEAWSEATTLVFEVPGPWYQTWWGYLIFLIVVIIMVSVVTNLYSLRLIRQKRNLEGIVAERTEEINEQKNEIIKQKNEIIKQKEELLNKNETVYASKEALNEADLNFLKLKRKQLQDQIEQKNKQITTHTLHIIQKNETLKDLRNKLDALLQNKDNVSAKDLRQTVKIIDGSFKLDKDWEDFRLYFEQIYTGFYTKLKINHPDLSQVELRHCALIRLNLSIAECSSILGISHDSAKVSRTRIRKKLELPPNQKLQDFILSL